MEFHPIANCLPALADEDFEKLKASIDQHGQRKPIITIGGQILAGRNRYRACRELGRPPIMREYDPERDGANPALFVIDEDLIRRHLSPGQRAAVHVELMKHAEETVEDPPDDTPEAAGTGAMSGGKSIDPVGGTGPAFKGNADKGGGNQSGPEQTANEQDGVGSSSAAAKIEKAAQQAGVAPDTIAKAKKLLKDRPDLFELVKSGALTLNGARQKMKDEDPAAKQERDEAADFMAEELGDEFGDAIRDGTILKGDELKAFIKLSVALRAAVQEHVSDGWKVADAVKYHRGMYLAEDPISDLIQRFLTLGKARSVVVIDGYEIAVKKAKEGQK